MGVDPGTRATGYGFIDLQGSRCRCLDFGAVRPPGKARLEQRLATIYSELSTLIEHHAPAAVAVEGVFHAVNVRSALTLGHARGVVLLAAAQHGVAISEFSPLEIKKAVVGFGRAEKHQVQLMVQRLLSLPEPPEPHDASDALAAALCRAFAGDKVISRSGSWRKIGSR